MLPFACVWRYNFTSYEHWAPVMKFGFGSSTEKDGPGKNGSPRIERVSPAAAIPGGEIAIHGAGFTSRQGARPIVRFGEAEATLNLASSKQLVVRVPENASGGALQVVQADHESQPFPVSVAFQIADNLHPVANPAVDPNGNIYVTFSGPRGQRVPVSLYKISSNYTVKPFVTSLINPTGLALDRNGNLFVSCRHDGTIYRVPPDGRAEQWMEGMGTATGIAFDGHGNLFVGDRSGTIFKISKDREIFVFATLEPSMSAYHLAFHPNGDLYVTGPTTSSYDRIYRITPGGDVHVFFRGLGRPQGMAFDRESNLYLAASFGGRRGIVRINPQGRAEHVLSGSALVGLALLPSGRAIVAANSALFTLDWDVSGLPLLG
jgi:sugar lactone lactonase YvrE